MTLNYQTPEKPPTHLHLESSNHLHTITFPLSPSWPIFLSITALFAVMAMKLTLFAVLVWIFFKGSSIARGTLLPSSLWPLLVFPFSSSLWGIAGWISIRSYRKNGHLPGTLALDTLHQTLSHRPERTSRFRQWPLSEIKKLRVVPVKHITGKITAETLIIRFRKTLFPLRLQFPSKSQPTLHLFLQTLVPLIPAAKVQRPTWPL